MSSWRGDSWVREATVRVPGLRPLEVLWPGTHNSATMCVRGTIFSRWARCQDTAVADQLRMGVRMLDFRVADDVSNRAIYITHRFKCCRLRPVLRQVREFLDRNQGEVVVLRVERDADRKLSQGGLARLARSLEEIFPDNMILEAARVPHVTIAEMVRSNSRVILVTKQSFYDEVERVADGIRFAGAKSVPPVGSPPPTSRTPTTCSVSQTPAVFATPPKTAKPTSPKLSQSLCGSLLSPGSQASTVLRSESIEISEADNDQSILWLAGRFLNATTSWKWTQAPTGRMLCERTAAFLTGERRGDFVVLEAILTHEINAILKNPFSSIKKANDVLRRQYLSEIIGCIKAQPHQLNAVACDFVDAEICRVLAEVSLTCPEAKPTKPPAATPRPA